MAIAYIRNPDWNDILMKSSRKENSAGDPCGLFRRGLIILYDAIVIIALLMLATLIAMLFGMANSTAALDFTYTTYLLLVWFLYLGWCWNRGGMTLGMRVWHVCIRNESGNRPNWGQCALRFLVSLLSLAVVGLGFIWSVFEKEQRTWHDLASHTRLLRK
jgi:uncharacterized RDD family membrane protein YckC